MTTELAPLTETEITEILQKLRRKEGHWLGWASSCQQLQKSAISPQAIFEATGFEPIHQNQIITASQVYQSLVAGQANPSTLEHFQQRGSDCLYELRILNQQERVWGAEIIYSRGLDADESHEIARALKNASRLSLPDAFGETGGDRIAAYYWNLARQQTELAERSRLIARGLSYAQSNTARQELETLLVTSGGTAPKSAPRLPFYRLESEEEMPRIIPVVGRYPITPQALIAIPPLVESGAFNLFETAQSGVFVPIPGWQVIRQAVDPVAVFATTSDLPNLPPDTPLEDVLVIVERKTSGSSERYYFVEQEGQAIMHGSAYLNPSEVLGEIILILRPKRILDETATFNTWLIDE